MMRVLDTNAVSEVLKKSPHEGFIRRLRAHPVDDLAVSAVTVFEIRHGCLRRGGEPLWQRIVREVLGRLRVLPVGTAEAERAADVLAALEGAGTPIGLEDVLIGATALVHGADVVSRNTRHLAKIPGLRVLDWWMSD
jgi:tRNA(fMet)-specific endonuclease VapC